MIRDPFTQRERLYIRKSTAKMLESLNRDQEQNDGFAGAVQAEFLTKERLVQYNLSAWRDEAAAKAWSQTNHAHKDTTAQYHQPNDLVSFSSVLMNLGPVSKGIRRHQRCILCKELSYNLETQTEICSMCGASLVDQEGHRRTAETLPWF